MNKLFKTKNFLIIEGVIAIFVIFFSLYAINLPILNPLKSLLENLFGVCIDTGPTPESGGSGLPCFFDDLLRFDIIVLAPIFVIYFLTFIIYRLNNKTTN